MTVLQNLGRIIEKIQIMKQDNILTLKSLLNRNMSFDIESVIDEMCQ